MRPNILFVSAPYEGRSAIWSFDLEGTGDRELVFASPEADVEDTITWPWDGRLLGFEYETDRPHAFYIDPVAQAIDETLRRLAPGRFASIIGGSRDAQQVLIAAYSDVKPASYYLLDLRTHTLRTLGHRSREKSRRSHR